MPRQVNSADEVDQRSLPLPHHSSFMSWWVLTKPVPLVFFLHSHLLPGSSSNWNAVLTDKQTHGSFAAIAGVVLYAFTAIQQNIWGMYRKEGFRKMLHTTWDNAVMQTHFEINENQGRPWSPGSEHHRAKSQVYIPQSFLLLSLQILYHMIYNDGCPEFLAI